MDSPSNEMARVQSVKSLASRGELEDLLRSGGLAKGAAKRIAAAGWPALTGEPDDAEPALDGNLTPRERKLVELTTAQWMGVVERLTGEAQTAAGVSDLKTLLTGNLSELKGIVR